MLFMNRILYALFFALLFIGYGHISAQTFYPVTHLTGTLSIGGNNVTVTPINISSPVAAYNCAGPYYIGAGFVNGFRFSFSTPANIVKANIGVMHNTEIISVFINGVHYMLNNGNIAPFVQSAPSCSGAGSGTPSTSGGDLICIGSVINTQIYISSPTPIDSIRIMQTTGLGAGSLMDFAFAYDTTAVITPPYIDTVKCPGDSIHLAYSTTPVFAPGNIFTAQLSDASGSFAAPVNIGTLAATSGGVIPCKLPIGTAAGNGYRIRIVGSSPVRISNDNGINIRVTTSLTPPVANVNTPVCEGSTLNFTVTGSTGSTYSWSGPASFSSGLQNPSISNAALANSGDYIVTATLNGCSAKDTITAQVKPMPAVPVAGNTGPVCEGAALGLSANSTTTGVSYNWTGPASFSSTSQNPSINNAALFNGGTYSVTVTLNGCTSAAGSTTATVKPVPAPPAAGNNTPICSGADIQLTAGSTTGGVSYSWSGPNGFTSSQQNPVIPASTIYNAGTYSVTATLNGCTSAAGSTIVVINASSALGGWVSPNDTICEGTLATFVVVPSNGGPAPLYQWFKNGQPVSGANTTLLTVPNIMTGDSFYCRMIAGGVCASVLTVYSNGIKMTVLPIITTPVAHINATPSAALPGQSVLFHATVTGGGYNPQFQWQRNGSNVLGAIYANWSANNLAPFDKINCIVTSDDPCAASKTAYSDTITVQFPTAIHNNINDRAGVELYPNPNNGIFTLKGSVQKEEASLEIANMIGRVVYRAKLTAQNNKLDKQVALPAGISNGVYIVKLSSGAEMNNFRIVVYR